MKHDSATLLVLLHCGISSGTFTGVADVHCQEGPTSSIPSLNQRQLRRKRVARRSRLQNLWGAAKGTEEAIAAGNRELSAWYYQVMVAAPYLVPRVLRGSGRV